LFLAFFEILDKEEKKLLLKMGTGGTFYLLELFWQFKLKNFCLTTTESWDVQLELGSTENWQLSNIKLVKLNQGGDQVQLILILTGNPVIVNIAIIEQNLRVNYVWLICITTVFVKHNIIQTKSGQQLCLI
jgi:hypothetical protein